VLPSGRRIRAHELRPVDLTGKVAVVTGGTRGIGLMIARGLMQAGASVYVSSRKPEAGETAVQELSDDGRAVSLPADLSSEHRGVPRPRRRRRVDRARRGEREQEAEALKAAAQRDTAIKLAGYQAEQERALAQTEQAGPLAEAEARKQVVVQESEVADLEAQRSVGIQSATAACHLNARQGR
jgi:NAD(P)-dependent dehydrogenase (short-subunit alcohol dehydrogenase family)